MIGYCSKCKHGHTVVDGDGWAKCGYRGCTCGWKTTVTPPERRNPPYRPNARLRQYTDRSLRAIILHSAADAYLFPNVYSDYDDLELGKRVLRQEADEAFAEGLRRGFPADLEALSKTQNDETLRLHREGLEGGNRYCFPEKLCSTCERILAGGNIWWPPS